MGYGNLVRADNVSNLKPVFQDKQSFVHDNPLVSMAYRFCLELEKMQGL